MLSRKSKAKVLLAGPIPPPWTGMAVGTEILLKSNLLKRDFAIKHVNLNLEGKGTFVRLIGTMKIVLEATATMVWYRPQVIHLMVTRSKLGCVKDFVFIGLGRLLRAKVCAHVRGGDLELLYDGCGPALRRFLRFFYRRVSFGIVLGETLAGQFDHLLPPGRVRVILNCFPEHEIKAPLKRPERNESDPLKVVFLSNVLPTKGLFDAIKGIALAIQKGVPIEFIFAGEFFNNDGALSKLGEYAVENVNAKSLEKRYNHLIDELGIRHRIKRIRVIQGQAKWNMLLSSDILLLPIYNPTEGQPLTIIEAMRSGCAVVTTTCGGIADIVEDRTTGRTVRPCCPEDIAEALEWIWKNPTWLEDVSKKNQQRAIVKHSPEDHVSAIIKVFEEALNSSE